MHRAQDIEVLRDLGLSEAEVKVYLALLGLPSARAGEVLRVTGLHNSVVHLTLGKLVEKGLVSFVKRTNGRAYQAVDPRSLLRLLDERRKRLESVLPSLLERQAPKERQEAQVFEGVPGFKAMCYQLIEGSEPGDEYLFFSFAPKHPENYAEVFDFYRGFEEDRVRRGIDVKGIAPARLRGLFAGRRVENIRFVDFPLISNVSVFRDRVLMTPWEERPVSFLVTSRELAASFREYFFSIWDSVR